MPSEMSYLRLVLAATVAMQLLCIDASVYDPSTAATFVYAAAAAYCSQSSIEAWNCAACLDGPALSKISYIIDAKTQAAAFVGSDASGNVWLSFRGTAGVTNWWENLKYFKTPFALCSGCNVHLGFFKSYNAIATQVLAALDGLGAKSAPAVFITGHSLGGALANLAAYELAAAGYPVSTLYNFGQPRVGDAAYATSFSSFVIDGQDTGAQTDDSTSAGGGGGGGSSTTGSPNGTSTTNPNPTSSGTVPSSHSGTQPSSNTQPTTTGSTNPTTTGGGGSTTAPPSTTTKGGGGSTTTTGGGGSTTTTGNGTSGAPTTTTPSTTTGQNHTVSRGHQAPSTRRSAWLRSTAASELVLNVRGLVATQGARREADLEEWGWDGFSATESQSPPQMISAIFVRAVETALDHPINRLLVEAHGGARNDRIAALLDALRAHAIFSAGADEALFAPPVGVVVPRPLSAGQARFLERLSIPAFARTPEDAAGEASESRIACALRRQQLGRGGGGATVAARLRGTVQQIAEDGDELLCEEAPYAFPGAEAFRVTHYADIVPHIPPSFVGYKHSVEEVWYTEDSSSFTRCSVKIGEDGNCSDSQYDTSVADHLEYLNIPISNSC